VLVTTPATRQESDTVYFILWPYEEVESRMEASFEIARKLSAIRDYDDNGQLRERVFKKRVPIFCLHSIGEHKATKAKLL